MRTERGFTLIELLVVLVILGCLVGLATLSSNGTQGRVLHDEAERLAALISVLADEAVLDNSEYGLQFSNTGYRVLRYNEQKGSWFARHEDKEHRLPSNLRLQLTLGGEPLQLVAAPDRTQSWSNSKGGFRTTALQPQLLILSSGECSAFELRIEELQPQGQSVGLASDGFHLPRLQESGTE